jgi:ribosomal protein S4E
MKTFEFNLDQKHTVWYRNTFEVKAKTLEEAKTKAVKLFNTKTIPDNAWEINYETLEEMTLEDNDNFSTEELFYNDEIIAQNGEG